MYNWTGIQRFIKFLEEIATNNNWEYEDGTSMRQDAQDFLAWVNNMEYNTAEDD